ncbi:uncharacterized protein [Typha angustifolia]|uniref:uncharacterized protein isoform X1 n=1 Tax=Typha angustifolia TaxID=59011 RepID=UPI003C2DC3EF
MKLTCLSEGSGFHFPPCHMLELSGFRLLLECPLDLSALTVFSPIRTTTSTSTSSLSGLINALPWYKTVAALHLWDPSLIDAVLVSSPSALLGIPFLTRNPKFTGKIYATEVTARIGRLMMEDLVAMHAEFVRYHGPDDNVGLPEWMKWEELKILPLELRRIVMGEEGEELGSWMPLYSAADVKRSMQKIQPVKYAEETCFNGTLILKAFSSGLDIGSCNWTVSSPRRSISYLSSSIFESAHAMDFDYHSLRGNDLVIFSDFSSLNSMDNDCDNTSGRAYHNKTDEKDASRCSVSDKRATSDNKSQIVKDLCNTDESVEETDKIGFIASCIINSLKAGGSVLIPIGRLGVVLLLLEQISETLEYSNMKVPIFMISTTAQETLAFTNAVPEWLCKKRQEKLFSGEALFSHSDLMKEDKLCLFSLLYSTDLLMAWQEPSIVLSPHWSLRLGSVVQLLQCWHADNKCLIVLETDNMQQGINPEVALLPYNSVDMKVLQCSFLSGIKIQKIPPLLELLQPKLVLFPEILKSRCPAKDVDSCSFLYYSENKTIHVPSLRKDFDAQLATQLAVQLQPRRLLEKKIAIARLEGKLLLSNGKYHLVGLRKPLNLLNKQLLYLGPLDPACLLVALREREIIGSIHGDNNAADGDYLIRVIRPGQALVKTNSTRTVISCEDEKMGRLIYEVLSNVCDRI